MGKLIYSALASLDGYIADEDGNFDYLYGRRLYETMVYWDDPEEYAGWPEYLRDFADIWQAADKIVYSTTLESPSTARTRVERKFDPDAVRALKEAAGHDLAIGGADLAGHAFRAGLVDECQLFLVPAIVGGGNRCLPDGVRLDLELVEERRFGNGTVLLRYSA